MFTYTPLRYPGGKAKIYFKVKKLITKNFTEKPIYVEGYAGGCGLALKLLLNNVVSEIHINDLDYSIYSFWYSILNYKSEFVKLINDTPITIQEWYNQKQIYINKQNKDLLEIGFATFFLNRTNRSGILKAGPIGGHSQQGNYKIDCRFKKDNLIDVINAIHEYRDRIHIYNLDASQFIPMIDKLFDNALIYLDPPYIQQGHNLYLNSLQDADHKELSVHVAHLKNKWFITYDNVTPVKNLYQMYNINEFSISYNAQKKRKETELVIFDNRLIHEGIF